ncbi:D-alanyl-D-alanine carboxypeptidase/D-alanyl-D-alanine endopeptidase [Solicola gregarius]|uniref:D-alanyl-D-alanine carboxypeptidase/D-alanyl-D-alanine-endopeptidase n=1 Tax=Solicola gregarius TaxID=2908642 RepID=A0AA46TKL3_9ACTN|nr:D-alanyl-D-alanine carboxypeptidase/D-alanyl-D-alanine-endopeptidase [Solicola gregarius]UYM07011.1 D-alanyl-D-alanine carboxypeptidase/D-alanyl-D-alanine-endopeptidase [Solicola gregarius]
MAALRVARRRTDSDFAPAPCRIGRGDPLPDRREIHQYDLGRIRWYVAVLTVVVLVVGGGIAAYALGGFDRWLDDSDASALDVEPPEELDFPAARTPQPVLDDATPGQLDRRAVEASVRAVFKDRTFGKHTGVAVAPLEQGKPVTIGSGSYMPASTLKNFTSLAALDSLGRDARFTTSVVRAQGAGRTARLTLVGGGDPLLATKPPKDSDDVYPQPATLADLADQTAKALKQDGVKQAEVSFDDSLFKGPDVNPRWEDSYITTDVTTPVSALWADEGVTDVDTGERTTQPAKQATEAFVDLLAKRGVSVKGAVSRKKAPADSADIASVDSPPLGQIVQHTLALSDNSAADVIQRQLAIGEGEPASFEGGARAMQSVLKSLGVPWQGIQVYDGSGLSRDNAVTLRAELAVLKLAATSRDSDLRPVASGLPVAGFSGSLADRFTSPTSYAGLGVARAKTGTLTGTHAYAGLTTDKQGTPLAFVAIANDVKDKFVLDARAGLDDIAAALTSCACTR